MSQNPGGAYSPPAQQQKSGNGFGTAALVLGILALIFSFIPVVGVVSFILAPLAIIFGILGIRKKLASKGTSIAGLILGAIALLIAIIMTVVVGSAVNAIDQELNDPQSAVEETVEPTSEESAPADSSAPAEDEAPAEQAFPGAQESDVIGQAGEELQLGDVTVTSSPLAAGADIVGPTLCSTVSLTNNSSETIDFNGFDWKLQEPGGTISDITFGGSENELSGGQIAPGGTTSGDVCFEGEGTDPGTYVVLYEPIFSFFSDRAAWINER